MPPTMQKKPTIIATVTDSPSRAAPSKSAASGFAGIATATSVGVVWRSAHSQHEKAKAFEPREHGFAMVRHAPSSNSYAYRNSYSNTNRNSYSDTDSNTYPNTNTNGYTN